MKRADIVVLALQGSHGKPRPAIVVQSDVFGGLSHVAVVLLTSSAVDAPLIRVPIAANSQTGLATNSYAMLDRLTTAPRDKVGAIIGQVSPETMHQLDRALAVFLGLA